MTRAIARPLAVAIFSTVACLVAAFAGETGLGLAVAVTGTVAFVATSRRALVAVDEPPNLGDIPATGDIAGRETGDIVSSPADVPTTPVTVPANGTSGTDVPGGRGPASPAQWGVGRLEESSPSPGMGLPSSVGATGSAGAALLHPSAVSKALGDPPSAGSGSSSGSGFGSGNLPVSGGRLSETGNESLSGGGYFAVTLFQRVASARRQLHPLSLVLIEPVDLENLPQELATAALTALGGTLRGTLRECDIACRYNDTIAAALLEDTSEEGAVRAVTRLRVALAGGPPMLQNLSIAVACYPSHALDARTLLERAIEALEYARGSGSGQVEVARLD